MLNNLRGCLNKSLLKFQRVLRGDKMSTCSVCGIMFYPGSASGYCTACEKKASGGALNQASVSNWTPMPPLLSPIYWGSVEKSQPKLEPEEMVVDALVGWRRWDVPMFQSVLMSNNKVVWKPYEMLTAECRKYGEAPSPATCRGIHCTCGIYAYKEQAQAEHGDNQPTDVTHVWGQVYLWGRVVEHDTGFRAQYAYPKALVNTGGIARQLAQEYGIPVITVEPTPKPEPKYVDAVAGYQYYVQYMNAASGIPYSAAAQANANPPSTSGQSKGVGFTYTGGIDPSFSDFIPSDIHNNVSLCRDDFHGYHCTRAYGHTGSHAAHGSPDRMYAKWD